MVLRVLQTGGGEACTNQCGWMRETEWCGWVHKAKRSSGSAERRLGGSERRLGRAGEAAELCGAAELLGAQGKAEQRLGGAERRLGGAGEAAELCGAAEILGVPLTQPDVLFQFLVDLFRLPVSLGVVSCGCTNLNPKESVKLPHELCNELCTTV